MNTLNNFVKLHVLIISAAFLLFFPYFVEADESTKNSLGVEIVSIKYGSRPDNLVPVTNKIMDMLKSGTKIMVSKSLTITDPAPGERKYVYVVFSVDGNKSSIKIMDGETFDLAFLQKRYGELANQKGENTPKGVAVETKAGSDKNQKTVKFDPESFRSSVNQAVAIVSGNGDTKIGGIEMIAYSKAFKAISDNPEVEKTMGIDNEWYLNISKTLLVMSQYKMEMEISQQRNLVDRFEKAKIYFSELSKKFKYLIEHPVKIQKK